MKKIIIILIILVPLCIYFFQIGETKQKLTSDEAIFLIKQNNPEFNTYPSDNLPPKSIKTEGIDSGWLVGFYMQGSGLPGILRATCFRVTDSREIIYIGEFTANGRAGAADIDLNICIPK